MASPFTNEQIEILRARTRKARPYRPDEDVPMYFDKMDERDEATMAMEALQRNGLWTEDDEREVFGK